MIASRVSTLRRRYEPVRSPVSSVRGQAVVFASDPTEIPLATEVPTLIVTGGQNLVTDFLHGPDSEPNAGCLSDFEMRRGTPLPPGLG